MAFQHGIYYSEVQTALQPMLSVDMPVVAIGVASMYNATNPAPANTPQLIYSFADYVDKFGYDDDYDTYTLSEVAYCFFTLYNVRPVICINVLDVTKHKKTGSKTVSLTRNRATFASKAILSSLVVKSGDKTLTATDYTAEYDDGQLTITVKTPSKVTGNSLQLTYDEVDASKVEKDDIISAIDLISEVYPRFQVVPGALIVPKYSTDSEVVAVMTSKILDINTCFNCISLADISTLTVREYADCTAHKSDNNLVDKNLYLCWPKVKLGSRQFHLSTQAAAMMCRVDASEGSDVPYISPSNHALKCDGAVLADGTEIFLGKDKATYLNSVGIATALNFAGAWRLFGNRSAAYPLTADVKDNFITNRRMFNWIGNTLIISFFYRLDAPINRRFVQSIMNSAQIWLNSLVSREMLIGARIEFLEEENPVTELSNGHIIFHLFVAPPSPAEVIEFKLELDVNYFANLFS